MVAPFIGEKVAKHNLNISNLMQTFENFLLQNYSTEFLDIAHKLLLVRCNSSLFKWWHHLYNRRINNQRQFEHRKFNANLWKSCPKLLQRIPRYYTQIVLVYLLIKVCSNGGAT